MILNLIPHEELVRRVDEEARKHLARIPEPTVVNADALATMLSHRGFQLGRVGYRVPPVRYRHGVRLLIAANTLRDLRKGDAQGAQVAEATDRAIEWLRPVLRPRFVFGRLRLEPLRALSMEELEGLIRWVLHVPDGAPALAPTGPITVDWCDEWAGVVRAFPALVGRDGLPRYWGQFIYAARHLGRARNREDVRLVTSLRVAQYEAKDFRAWLVQARAAAGWL